MNEHLSEPLLPEKLRLSLAKLENNFNDFSDKLHAQKMYMDEVTKHYQHLQKETQKFIHKYKKICQKSQHLVSKKNGFAKEVEISDDLCSFMNLPPKTRISRTQVTKFIMDYIKHHQLYNPLRKKQIVPDESLWKILGNEARENADNLTYFSLQKYMNKHFLYINNSIN